MMVYVIVEHIQDSHISAESNIPFENKGFNENSIVVKIFMFYQNISETLCVIS